MVDSVVGCIGPSGAVLVAVIFALLGDDYAPVKYVFGMARLMLSVPRIGLRLRRTPLIPALTMPHWGRRGVLPSVDPNRGRKATS